MSAVRLSPELYPVYMVLYSEYSPTYHRHTTFYEMSNIVQG